MSIVDYELRAVGRDYGAKYGALDDDGWVWVPIAAKFLSAVAQAQYQTGEEKDDHVAVPFWVLAALVDGVYEPSELGLYASDSMVSAHVIGATLKDAEDSGFYMRAGTRTVWPSLEAHANDLASFAAEQRAAGNAEPYMLEEDDFHTLTVAAWSAGHPFEVLNELVVTDLTVDDLHVSTKTAWLLYPVTPAPDLSEGTQACIVMKHLISTAKAHEPGLAAISLRLAVARLLHVPLPYQLANIGISLMGRINYISKLAAWAITRDRSSIIENDFKLLLNDLPTLSKWVLTAVGPFQKAMTLVVRLGGDASAIGVDTFVILEAKLITLDSAWRDGQSADANISFLLDKMPRQASAGGITVASADDSAISSIQGGSEHLARMALLDTNMNAWAANGRQADAMEGITIIYESGVSLAIRWLQGTGSAAGLPPVFRNSCEMLPGKLDEYVLDAIMHDEEGNLDEDLEGLTARSLYIKGATTLATQRAFFTNLVANRFTAIDWEKMLIAPIWMLMCPGRAVRVWSMAEVYLDQKRLALHTVYVTRALAAVGKLETAPNSYAALINEWTAALARAERGGAELAADCIDNIVPLMDGGWASAEAIGVASLKGTFYTPSLFDGDIPEVASWRTFQEGLVPMKQMLSRYKRTFASLLKPAVTVNHFEATDTTTSHTRGLAGSGGGAGGSGGGAAAGSGLGGGKALPMPAPGSRVAKMATEAGWSAATEYASHWYHVENCKAMAAKRFGCKDACVMSVVTQGAPRGYEAEWALAYCDQNHSVDAPEHALLAKRTEYMAAMDDTMFQQRAKLRQQAVASGKVVGKRPAPKGGRGRGKPFPRQTARPQ